jgi:hypothetical protein
MKDFILNKRVSGIIRVDICVIQWLILNKNIKVLKSWLKNRMNKIEKYFRNGKMSREKANFLEGAKVNLFKNFVFTFLILMCFQE